MQLFTTALLIVSLALVSTPTQAAVTDPPGGSAPTGRGGASR